MRARTQAKQWLLLGGLSLRGFHFWQTESIGAHDSILRPAHQSAKSLQKKS